MIGKYRCVVFICMTSCTTFCRPASKLFHIECIWVSSATPSLVLTALLVSSRYCTTPNPPESCTCLSPIFSGLWADEWQTEIAAEISRGPR